MDKVFLSRLGKAVSSEAYKSLYESRFTPDPALQEVILLFQNLPHHEAMQEIKKGHYSSEVERHARYIVENSPDGYYD
jgi:hypothetical protein